MQHSFGDGGAPPGPSPLLREFGGELDPLDVDGLLSESPPNYWAPNAGARDPGDAPTHPFS